MTRLLAFLVLALAFPVAVAASPIAMVPRSDPAVVKM
jgi:hypothetical protein